MRAPEEAHACTCDWPGVQAAVDRVDLVVVARFVSSTGLVEGLGLRETIQVERYLKGSGPEMIDVYDSPSTCGVMLGSSPGERWLVLASLDDSGVPHTGKCHGTTRLDPPDPYTDEVARATFLSEVETVLGAPGALTGPGAFPDGGGGNQPTHATGLWIIPLLVAAGATGAAGVFLFVRGRSTAA